MKRKLIMLLSIFTVLSLAGCGVKEKVYEKTTEKVLEKATGVKDVKIDSSKEKVTIEGDDGEKISFGAGEWPDSELTKKLPKLEKGEVVSVFEMPNAVVIGLEKVAADDFSEYLDKIKKVFPNDAFTMNSEGYFSYGAGNEEGDSIAMSYSEDQVSITYTQAEE